MSATDSWYAESTRKRRFVEIYTVMGLIVFIASIVLILYRSQTDVINRTTCAQRLKRLVQAVSLYTMDYDGEYPPEDKLYTALLPYIDTSLVFICPADDGLRPMRKRSDSIISYWYTRPTVIDDSSATAVTGDRMFSNFYGNHGDKGGNVGYIDGHVKWKNISQWQNEDIRTIPILPKKHKK